MVLLKLVLIATSFRAASSQQATAECTSAVSKYTGFSSECGDEGAYTCSASACIASAASASDSMVADMVTGLATCTGAYASFGSFLTAESLTLRFLSTFNACGLTSALTPLSLSTCMGAMTKMGEMSSCGDDGDDADNPRTAATCASSACTGFVASMTDEALQGTLTGLASCTGPYAAYQNFTDYVSMIARKAASGCGLTTALTPVSLNTCVGAITKIGEMSSCGKDDDDDDKDGTPRTPATCASDACVGFVSSMTDEALQEVSTGIASCTGLYAGYQVMAGAYLRMSVLSTASECGLASALTPVSLNTCVGAMIKIGEMSSCGKDDDDDDDDADNPRTAATCASDACVGFIASMTDEALQDTHTGLASCTGPFAGYQNYSAFHLRGAVLHAASECDLTSVLTPASPSTCEGAYSRIGELFSSCGNDDDDDDEEDKDDDKTPRTPATCASETCVGFMSSMTDDALQDMTTGIASCPAEMGLTGDHLIWIVRKAASDCGLATALTPLPLSTCVGAYLKVVLWGGCGGGGDDDDDDDKDVDNDDKTPRTPATCASEACVGFVSSMTDAALQDVTAGIASCPAEMGLPFATSDFLRMGLLKAASDCNLATALTTPVLCQAGTYDSLASEDAACQLWLDAGHSCSTKWEGVCDNDNPNGADQNSYTVASISCTQCPVDLCSPTTYFEGISENLICDLWFDAGHSCETKWEDVCTMAHPRGAQFNSNTLSTVNCFQCPTCGTSWGNYVLADLGAHDCMGCGEPITSYNDCVIAALSGAAALGIGPLRGSENRDGPPGCHIQEGSSFQFNANMDGTSAEGHTPVCLISSSPLPPSPPPSPPTPPPPPSPEMPGTSFVEAEVFEISVKAAGTVETFDKAGFETNMRSYLGCNAPLCQVAIAVTAGSVNVVATVTDSTSTAVAATAKLTTDVVDVRALSTALGVTVEAAPTVSAATKTMLTVRPAAPSPRQQPGSKLREDSSAVSVESGDELSVGAIAGIAVGCLVVAACFVFTARRSRRRSAYLKKQRLEDAEVTLTRLPSAGVQARPVQSAVPEIAAVPGIAVKKQGIDYV